MAFDSVDRPPFWELGYWVATLRQWYRQGLPEVEGIPASLEPGAIVRGGFMGWKQGEFLDVDVQRCMDLDEAIVRIPLNNFVWPEFEPSILEEHENWVLRRDEWGGVRREKKDHSSLPSLVSGPVRTREDWERFAAERLRPDVRRRLPADWQSFLDKVRDRDFPLAIGGSQGFFGTARYLLGDTELLYAFYDKPDLIKTINTYLADFWIDLYDPVLEDVRPDLAVIWEDMCSKNGPLVSPQVFEEFMLPHYRKLTGFFRAHGVDVILVDTDGDCRTLIPLFLRGGVTGLYPFEVTGGMDVAVVGREFPDLQIIGGLSKAAVSAGPEAIDGELEAKVEPSVDRGGFIPMIDHSVQPTTDWDNFVYYRGRLAELYGQRTTKLTHTSGLPDGLGWVREECREHLVKHSAEEGA